MEESTNYTYTREMWDCNKLVIDNKCVFIVATEIANDFKPQTVDECRQMTWLTSIERSNSIIIDFFSQT